jgi:hypothetical protein
MASEDNKTSPGSKSETAVKTEVPAKKKVEGQAKEKTTSDSGPSQAEAAPAGYSRGEGQKPVSKAYKDNWNAIYAKKKRNDK